ncbi:hypothetical protein [Pedobacter foliorum]|uniref:hypothetical protein n=1 Tax=Pedobacter foliorum TaxID=2739058 RepID=UPI0015644A30|nr:hypothetical protein [Pedobacter foliorum]NRF40219.1 hypothetical protein [Pedobacter foliorum]
MLYAYKPINYKLKDVQILVESLVLDVWCKPNKQRCRTRLNDELKAIFDEYDWFKDRVNKIYSVCKNDLTAQDITAFKNAFENNNQIEKLCDGTLKPIYIKTLHSKLRKPLTDFFSELYTKFLGWALIYNTYKKKKDYYDELISKNNFIECPCCGFGDIKTEYSDGHSPFDHYLPQKYYPLSTINFDNLVPMCHICNSDNKGEKDIIKNGQKVFYPFATTHPIINVVIDFDTSKLPLLIKKSSIDTLPKGYFKISFNMSTDEISAWDKIFKIRNRYSAKVADNRVSWFNDVRQIFRDTDIHTPTSLNAIDKVIQYDSKKHLGIIKTAYLTKFKSMSYLLKAIEEVTGSSQI